MNTRACTLLGLAFCSSPALAQTTVAFDVDPAAADAVGLDAAAVSTGLEDAIRSQLQLIDPDAFMASMAEAAAIAGKGIGVDYATNPQQFVFGLSLGTGANAAGLVLGRGRSALPEAGFAFQASAMAGLNLGVLAGTDESEAFEFWDRFVVSAYGMAFRSPASQRMFQGWMGNVGGHVTVKLIGRGSQGVFEWGGLDLTSGFERAMYELRFAGNVPFTQDVGDGTVRWDADGTYTLAVTSDSVPIELSTNLRVSVVTVFLGAGADWNLTGVAQAEGTLTGPIVGQVAGTSEQIGTGRITNASSGTVAPTAFRGFGGVQINLLPVKVYAMVQGSSRASAAAQAGIRIAI